jgi:hypothetical protein
MKKYWNKCQSNQSNEVMNDWNKCKCKRKASTTKIKNESVAVKTQYREGRERIVLNKERNENATRNRQ